MYFKKHALILILFLLSQQLFSQGIIKGNISDAVTKDGLARADIAVSNTPFRKAADDKGNFELLHIPAGEYDLVITNVGYNEAHYHVTVKDGRTTSVFIRLTPQSVSMNEVTVFGHSDREKETGSRDRERNAANMINVISSQAMVRSPDINAANVLQRMSGITIQRNSGGDEAYAVIRGMEPRYNNTLLNGIKIASPDNKNRYVQLNIIPSDILSSIEISKSLLPDMEGDATGGTVNMVVRDAPDKTSFKATASIGYSQLFFDEKYLDFKKSAIQSLSPVQRNSPKYNAQPGDFSRSNLDFQPRQAPPTALVGFSFTHRYLHDKLGFVLADNLQNQYYGNIGYLATTTPGSDTTGRLHPQDGFSNHEYTQQLNNGLVAHLDYVINEKNKINIDNFYLYSYLAQSRISFDTTLVGTGWTGPGTGQVHVDRQSQTQHQYVENLKLSGQHVLSPIFRLDWSGVYADAGSRQPDVADINTDFLINSDHSKTATYWDDIIRAWQKNNDKQYSGVLNLDWHKKFGDNDLQLKAGGLYRHLSRYNTEDDYRLIPPATNASGGANSKPFWTNIYDAQWDVFNPSGSTYNPNSYKASETIYAEYLMFRYKIHRWEAGGGLRVEHTDDNWNVLVYVPGSLMFGNQTYQDFLPSAFARYRFSEKQDLHLSYFRSIARPGYYELVPTPGSIATTSGTVTEGNPYVQHSVADNIDIRYELFPKGEEHLFIGAFYKHIQNPIEIQLDTTGTSVGKYQVKPLNSYPADNFGGEISFTQYWGRFGVTGNYAYTHSTISSDQKTFQGKTVRPVRPMQGQSEHVANLSLLYKDTRHGAFTQLAYEYQGTTLAATGLYAGADYYQRPTHTLSLSAEKDIHKHFTVFGKFNNLLNTAVEQYVQNTILVLKNTYRATYNIGIRYEH